MNKDIEIKFLSDLTKTRADYIDQENSMKKCLKISSYIRAISLLLIPVFTFWNFLNGGLVIILTAIISFTEFYIKFNKFDYKLNLLNIVITNLDMEYYLYHNMCGCYSSKNNSKNFKLFVKTTTLMVKEIELKLNNKYDMDAAKNIRYTSKDN